MRGMLIVRQLIYQTVRLPVEFSVGVICRRMLLLYIIIMALQHFIGPWPLLQFLDPIHSRYDSLDGDQPVARPLFTHRTTQTQNKRTQYRHPCLEWDSTHDPSVRASEDSAATDRHRRIWVMWK
jgi:hypothetical protein